MSLPEGSLEGFKDRAACLQPHSCPDALTQTPALPALPQDVLTSRSLCTETATQCLPRKTLTRLRAEILTQGDSSSTGHRPGQPPGTWLFTHPEPGTVGKETRSGQRAALNLSPQNCSHSAPGLPRVGSTKSGRRPKGPARKQGPLWLVGRE